MKIMENERSALQRVAAQVVKTTQAEDLVDIAAVAYRNAIPSGYLTALERIRETAKGSQNEEVIRIARIANGEKE